MRYLECARTAARKLLPGLDERLEAEPLMNLERPGSPGIEVFREHRGPGLLVPAEHGGGGASALEAVRVQRAVGARSPSLAVATAMHHFSMASLVALAHTSNGFEWMLLEAVATGGKLLASGFGEGRPGTGILEPTMTAVAAPDGVRVSGVKRPCSLARSMDLLTASVVENGQLSVVMIPAGTPGVRVSPFWGSFALAGAESEQVTVEDVFVPDELVVRTGVRPGHALDEIQSAGFVWFELLIAASYLGMASALVERTLADDRIPQGQQARLVVETEAAMGVLENIARQVPPQAPPDQRLLADALFARYAVQDAIARATPCAVELLGGLRFIAADDVGYLAACVNGLSFHPPSRARMDGAIIRYLSGEPLTVA